MQQVADWLQKLGLGKYAQSFAENDISFSILPDLTDQDFKELGVTSLGHRRQLLRAIADLTDSEPPSSKPAAELIAPLGPRDAAERRQVTVMFSDLVGSTALSARMDPEDLREIISSYQKCVAESVQHFGGFVAKYMGDGVLIYFGYPQAHEDDAERAVRAGLELVAAVSSLKTHAPLQTRVGMATGLVVVGDLIGSGASQEQAIVGETPNLAARLQGVAEPNSVVISESTRRLVGNLFELQDLGAQDLKGFTAQMRAWAALRPSSVESRFEALHGGGLTELVGREEELGLLLRCWSIAKSGEGQVVLLSGEPGIGKSRLTAALLERIAAGPHTRLRYFCSPQHTDSALYPFISQMERAAGFAHDNTVQAKLDKLDALLEQSLTPGSDAALLAEMLSLPNDGRYSAVELAPQQRRQKTLEALAAQLEALSQSKPVLMIFEDVHWVDPTSLEMLGRTVHRLKGLGVFLIITYRPEFDPPWIGRPNVTALNLNRLGEDEIAAIVDRLTGNTPLPKSIRQDIIERTDGIPLFIEEMTRAVLEAQSDWEARKTASAVPPSTLAVPASLHASLMARLDRLGPAKGLAQIGAVIGREFSHALLAAVASEPEAKLLSTLERLTAAGLLLRQGIPPQATYLFKHALIQDAAYGTLLRGPRRALHAHIADTLENHFTDIAESQPEVVARHCTEAGLIEKALGLWGKAGQRSLARSALAEAMEQLTRALDQISSLPSTPALRRDQIKFQIGLTNASMHVKGYAASETRASLDQSRALIERAETIGEPPEDPLLLFSVLYGFWVANVVAFDGVAVRELATQFLALAERQGATVPLLLGHRVMGYSLMLLGDLVEARKHLNDGIALYDPAQHRSLATRFGQDPGVTILSCRSWVLWYLGNPEAALKDADQAVINARAIGHAATSMFALAHASAAHLYCGDYSIAKILADQLTALADEKDAVYWKTVPIAVQGYLFVSAGKFSDAVQLFATAVKASRSTGATFRVPAYLTALAMANAELGQLSDAWRCIEEVMRMIEMTKGTLSKAEADRVAGELALKPPQADTAKAEGYFERALAVARQQQAKSWELRASMSLARLWRDQGKVNEARLLLAPVYGWFTEGFDTRDLKEAKALMEELGT
jgi:class 3 adenylate cyclase/predicted ATPase